MMRKCGIKLAVVMSVLLAPLTSAHHSAFLYHLDTLDTAEGVLTEVEWINPHPAFYFDIADEEGRVTNWQLEGISPAFYSAKGLRGLGFPAAHRNDGDRVLVRAEERTAKRFLLGG